MDSIRSLRPALQASLRSATAWFHGMVTPGNRIYYAFHSRPQPRYEENLSCPIRDIGTAADLAVLQRHLGSTEFDPVIAATLEHYQGMLMHCGKHPVADSRKAAVVEDKPLSWGYLSAGCLGEPSSVATSSMLLLALVAWEGHALEAQSQQVMRQLAAGILHQQRDDGSFKVYFEPQGLPDSGWQLYGGEAAYALAAAYGRLRDDRLLHAARCALSAYQAAYRRGLVDPDELTFFANWQQQVGAAVHRHTAHAGERRRLAAYLAELQDAIIDSGFFTAVQQAPEEQATVEVACALEGLAHCLQAKLEEAAEAAAAEHGAAAAEEQRRLQRYADCARVAVAFLLQAQVAPAHGVPAAAVGGWGHTVRHGSGQRVDVTGHVCCAFIKLLELQ